MRQILAVAFILMALQLAGNVTARELPSLEVAPFGTVRVFMPEGHPSRVVIFLAGEERWDPVAEELAARMAALDCLVIGVDTRDYLGRLVAGKACTYPASDFENLSRFVQQKLGVPQYTQPLLAGYSLGSVLVYATLVQSPAKIFAGGISMGFCPDAPLIQGVCPGLGLAWSPQDHRLVPAHELHTPWIVLPRSDGKDCSPAARAFLDQIQGAKILGPPGREAGGVGDDPSKDLLIQAFANLTARDGVQGSAKAASTSGDLGALKDLPLVEVPAEQANAESRQGFMAVFLSGDGGWVGLDREVGDAIAKHGIPVVGLSSLRYFWTPRTPEGTAGDMTAILRHYLDAWKKEKAILIGYSFGADVLPFVVNRLPEDLKARIDRVVLLGPSTDAQFQFHLSNWFEGASRDSVPTLPEVRRMTGQKLLCIYGKEEGESLCPLLDPHLAVRIPLPGGHHFDGNYPALAEKILALETPVPPGR